MLHSHLIQVYYLASKQDILNTVIYTLYQYGCFCFEEQKFLSFGGLVWEIKYGRFRTLNKTKFYK